MLVFLLYCKTYMESNNNFIVSARKYRPIIFDDVIGQEAICQTISNSIKNHQIPSGYIFTGIRGTGKTTLARIIAKTINCTDKNQDGTFIKICQKCSNCLASNQNSHPDIIEIDAASHTGVDDIRSIIDSAEYKPMQGSYKIFIIDEVHMLSKSAFNALLKIIEEPPLHVLFILATTEINKVPLTVSSRCQKFFLKRLTIDQITQLLHKIISIENFDAEEEALRIIAYKADGSARDALSLLDQAIAISWTKESKIIKTSIVREMIGIGDAEDIVKLLQFIIDQDASKAIDILHNIQLKNSNLFIFFENFLNFIGFIIKQKTIEDYKSLDYIDFIESIELIKNQIKLPYLIVLWQIFSKGIKEIKDSHNMLLASEMIVIKSIYTSTLPSLEEAMKSLVEKKNSNLDLHFEPQKKNSRIYNLNNPVIEKTTFNSAISYDNKIQDLLSSLYRDRKFDLYYYLFNEVEFEILDDNLIKISSINFNNVIFNEIQEYISNLFGKNYKLIRENKSDFIPYKEKIKNNFRNSKIWEKVIKNFTTASVDDVLTKLI